MRNSSAIVWQEKLHFGSAQARKEDPLRRLARSSLSNFSELDFFASAVVLFLPSPATAKLARMATIRKAIAPVPTAQEFLDGKPSSSLVAGWRSRAHFLPRTQLSSPRLSARLPPRSTTVLRSLVFGPSTCARSAAAKRESRSGGTGTDFKYGSSGQVHTAVVRGAP
mgnify:FL=1